MLLWKRYGNNKMAAILHLQQYSRRLNFFIFSPKDVHARCSCMLLRTKQLFGNSHIDCLVIRKRCSELLAS